MPGSATRPPDRFDSDLRTALETTRLAVRFHRRTRITCLEWSLVMGHLLRHYHPILVIGCSARDGEFTAHAWLSIGTRAVSQDVEGSPSLEDYSILRSMARPL